MEAEQHFFLNNLGLYRLENFVGRSQELALLKNWLNNYPVIAITGISGIGKSALATALAVSEATRFEEGILWIGATGDAVFNFYDIVRDIEDVLATGITNQPISSWPLLVLQQLYGYNRLLIIDELSNPTTETIDQIKRMIGRIGPGGRGSFILIGRTIPKPLLNMVGEAHLKLEGLDTAAIAAWIHRYQHIYPLSITDAPLLHRLTGGHALSLKIVANLWQGDNWAELVKELSALPAEDYQTRIQTILSASWAALHTSQPQAAHLLTRCSIASGGVLGEAVNRLFWQNRTDSQSLVSITQQLLRSGLLMYNSLDNRYLIHPVVRHYLSTVHYTRLSATQQNQCAEDFARYYLGVAHQYSQLSPRQWNTIDRDWGNIRKAFDYLVNALETAIELPVESALTDLNTSVFPVLPLDLDDILILIRDYALTLRPYLLWRHPPEAQRWLSAGIIASRKLADRRAEAIIGAELADLSYFHHDYQAAEIWYRHILPFFKESKNITRVIEVTKNLGTVLRAIDNLDEALEVYTTALSLAEKYQDYPNQAAISTLIGSIYYHQNRYQLAIEWYKKALALDKKHNNPAAQAVHYNNIGLATEASGDFEGAIEYYHKAIDLHTEAGNQRELCTTYGNLGAAYYQSGHPKQALQYYERDMEIQDRLGNWLELAAILHNMGHVALELDNLPAATDYFTRSRDLYMEFGQTDLAAEEQVMLNVVQDRRVVLR